MRLFTHWKYAYAFTQYTYNEYSIVYKYGQSSGATCIKRFVSKFNVSVQLWSLKQTREILSQNLSVSSKVFVQLSQNRITLREYTQTCVQTRRYVAYIPSVILILQAWAGARYSLNPESTSRPIARVQLCTVQRKRVSSSGVSFIAKPRALHILQYSTCACVHCVCGAKRDMLVCVCGLNPCAKPTIM